MGAPTNQIYFFSPNRNIASLQGGIGYLNVVHGSVRDTASPSITSWGWRYGNISSPRWAQMKFQQVTDFAVSNPTWSLTGPTGSVPNPVLGDCWVVGPLDGTFLAGEWKISMSMHGETASPGGTANLNYKFWKAYSPSGSGVTAITESYFTSSIATFTLPTITRTVTASFTLPQFDMKNEFLFLQVFFHLLTSSANSGAEAFMSFFNSSSLMSPPLMTHKGTVIPVIQEEQSPYLIDFTNEF